jgi:cardiolipin synthase A/B
MATLLSGCSTTNVPNVFQMIHARWPYREPPKFVGRRGPLSREQGERILEHLAERSGTSLDLLQKHLAFEQAISGAPLMLGNQVTLLENGPAAYAAMFQAIEGATDSINLETFTYTDDSIGAKFADALIEKQKQGVQVDVIYDSVGSFSTPESFFDRMRSAGIRVSQFNPINPLWARVHWEIEHRDHRKLMIIDGRTAFTGGINISGVYSSGISHHEFEPGDKPPYWRDTDVEIQGPAVAECQELFLATWADQGGRPLPARDYYPSLGRRGHEIVRVIGSVPQRFPLIYVTLISAISNAERNVWITDAYFAPDPQLIGVLERSARRGIDVRLVLPSNADEPLIESAARSYYSELMAAGVKVYEWRGEMLHAKTATIDGVWSTVGSSNLDTWSIARNNEINAVVLSPEFGDAMNEMYRRDISQSDRIDPQTWQDRGIIERAREYLARMMQPML